MLQPNRVDRGPVLVKPAWIVRILACILAYSAIAGCDRTSELADQARAPQRGGKLVATNTESVDRQALAILEKSTAAYARITSYEDSGRVVMSYRFDGKPIQDVAPLALAYESPNRLGMRAYQVIAGPSQNRFRLRVGHQTKSNPSANPSDASQPSALISKQVISRELPKQMAMPWLLSDPVAVEHWGAGLAGSPPQLELLLGEQPFRALLDGATEVALDGQGTDAGQTYQIIKVMRGPARYRLWVSATTFLLRRIELPTATLPAAMLADGHIADIRLSIELDDPRVGGHIDWTKWEVPISPLDQLVRYLTPPPIGHIDPKLGRALPAFKLRAAQGDQTNWDTSATAQLDKVQVLLWLADHPSCRAALDQLKLALSRLPGELRQRVAPVIVWAEANPPSGMTFESLKAQWQIDMPIVLDDGTIGRDLLAIDEAPALIVLDAKHRVQFHQQRGNPMLADILPDMLRRLQQGENLAQQAIDEVQWQQERFVAGLWKARASDCAQGAFTEPKVYAPSSIKLETVSELPVNEQVLGFCSDATRNLWMLQGDGRLLQLNAAGKVERELKSSLESGDDRTANRQSVRMAIDDAARFVAISSPSGERLIVLDVAANRASAVQLDKPQGNKSLNDFRWLDTPAGLRLAAITRGGKTLLIDPARFQQHSGQSNQMPLAILPRVAEEALTSGYVILNDGRIEPLIVQDEGGAKAAALAKPVSSPLKGSDKPVGASPMAGSVLNQLQFHPATGPWIQWRDPKHTLTLARGWLAGDEPAVFVLDDKLQQMWHAPLPIREGAEICGASVVADPATNQPLWVLATADATLHFLRADGQAIDDCRLAKPVRGVALVPMGQELWLWVAQPDKLVQYRWQPR